MEDKYFTPSIEDIRVGYECEIISRRSDWPEGKYEWEYQKLLPHHIDTYYNSLHSIRVPYLTKEQIEAEGWICIDNNERTFIKNKIVAAINFPNHTMVVGPALGPDLHYQGECKDINTFRMIVKLLGI